MTYLFVVFMTIGGVSLLRDAGRRGRGLREVDSIAQSLVGTAPGTRVDLQVEVAEGPPLVSPLTGSHAVFWNVLVERIISRMTDAPGLKRRIDVDVSSTTPFWATVEGQRVRVDTSQVTCNGGHRVVDRDQASFERSVVIEGVTHTSPPAVNGSRNIKECVLVPGQVIWVSGILASGADGLAIEPAPERGVVLDTKPFGFRLKAIRATVIASAGIGSFLLLGAGALLVA